MNWKTDFHLRSYLEDKYFDKTEEMWIKCIEAHTQKWDTLRKII